MVATLRLYFDPPHEVNVISELVLKPVRYEMD